MGKTEVYLKMNIKAKRQEGASAIEFAIILPLLLVLVFGIIEFSILFYDKAMLTNASREGARVGIVYRYQDGGPNHPDDTEIAATIAQYVQNHLISFGSGSVVNSTITRAGDEAGDSLTVTVNYQYNFLVFDSLLSLIGGSLSDGISLTAETVMRME
jgi:Flp pilus assembly protein TadG